MENVEQVFGKLVFGASHVFVENHDFAAGFFDDKGNEFPSKPCKAVTVGNHKLDTLSLYRSFQYGTKTFSFVVET